MAAARLSSRLPRASHQVEEVIARHRAPTSFRQTRGIRSRPAASQLPHGSQRRRSQNDAQATQSYRSLRPDQDGQLPQRNSQPIEPNGTKQHSQQAMDEQPGPNTQLAMTLAESDASDLITEVHIPDDPLGVLPPDHPARGILSNSSLVIQRQMEMMNILLGFEQANRYLIMNGRGETIGYIAERDHGIGSAMARQMFRTHRSFTTHIFDGEEREVLRIHRPFAYINSKIRIYDPIPPGGYENNTAPSTAIQGLGASSVSNQAAVAQVSPLATDQMRIIGEAQQQWAPLRRKYNLFSFRPITPAQERDASMLVESGDKPTSDTLALTESTVPDRAIESGMLQFAHVNEPFLSWDFNLRDEQQQVVGSVNRNFGGFAREIFTDTGIYALRMDSAADEQQEPTSMTLDQRAVMLATAVSIDFDYFSRHSHAGHGGFMPLWFPMGGGTAAEGAGAAGAGAAGAGAGAAETGAMAGVAEHAGATIGAGRVVGGGAVEGAIASGGTMAGYEAMQRGFSGSGQSQGGSVDQQRDQQSATATGDPSVDPRDLQQQNSEPIFDPDNQQVGGQQSSQHREESWWNDDNDPWNNGGGGSGGGGSGGGGSGGGGGDSGSSGPPPSSGADGAGDAGDGGGWLDSISDFFGDS